MDKDNQFYQAVNDLIQNEDFIRWRLFESEELKKYWEEYMNQNPHLEKALEEAIRQLDGIKINHYPISVQEKEHLYKKVVEKVAKKKRRAWFFQVEHVAAVLVIALLSTFFFWYIKQSVNLNAVQSNDMIMVQTLPEEDIYLVVNGEKTKLADKSHISLKGGGTAVVTDTASTKKELVLAKTTLNKLVVPYGKRTNLTLADGTSVWLNSGTQLEFPSEFSGLTREIFINGEIYIDVAKDANKPFIVQAKEMAVIVQGTAFNISAYKDDTSTTVVLVNGRVRVEAEDNYTAELIPNEKIEISENSISKEIVDVAGYISWTKDVLVFDETPVSEILKKIGRYYNVQFENNTDQLLDDKSCSGKLFLSSNLDSVMVSISHITSTRYQIDNNIVRINKK